MSSSTTIARFVARKAPSGTTISRDLDLATMRWHGGEGLGAHGAELRAMDFLEIARVVCEVERHLPKRVSSERIRTVTLEMPLRDPAAWTTQAKYALADMLRLLGNAEWSFVFTQRSTKTALDHLPAADSAGAQAVSLFSGGLDSTSGLGWLEGRGEKAVLASFYGAKSKQQRIASEFGIQNHVQLGCTWQTRQRRVGGQYQYRSLLFIALGALVARSFGATTLYQFENGPLAVAAPPSSIYRMTRHAHPGLHRSAEILFLEIFNSALVIRNPFLGQTKRESADALKTEIGVDRFSKVVNDIETCWNLMSRQVIGPISKRPGVPCGMCIPCLVRRTALGKNDIVHAIDFTSRSDPAHGDPNARVHLDAFLGWASIRLEPSYSLSRFTLEAPQVLRDAIAKSDGDLNWESAFDLNQRFASEWRETF